MERVGVAAVIIGNEVLTAKVADQNGPLLIRRLRDRGVPLRSIAVVPDEVDEIAEAVDLARRKAAHVITSGGIGPTHDDVTVRSVARALGRDVVRLPEMMARIRKKAGGEPPPAALRLADAPDGATLLELDDREFFPVLSCERVFLLPGVPQLFAMQLERVLRELDGIPVVVRGLELTCGETEIAPLLDRVAAENSDVAIGSYPKWGRDVPYRTLITVEHVEAARVEQVVEALSSGLPAGALLRVT